MQQNLKGNTISIKKLFMLRKLLWDFLAWGYLRLFENVLLATKNVWKSKTRVQIYKLQVQTHELRVQIHESRVQILVLED